ncbi:MAG: ion transporter [Halieaceae bacterium]|jgi:voltage-gated potassium channel|nr:ion transporter [Halieaceae bacterium]
MEREQTPLQKRTYDVIFGTAPGPGRNFDVALIILIVISVLIVMLDSIPRYHELYGVLFRNLEWAFTAIFTVEYVVRLWCSPNRRMYALSTYGIVDLLAILPTYVAVLIPTANSLLIIRLLRILRIFRVLRLLQFLNEANSLARALRNSRRKVFVFFSMMLVLMTVFGCIMYVIEGPVNGFGSIPESIYWAIVTITTVGYGDVVPQTPLGRGIAAMGMLIGYAIIAVPTGIITAELAQEIRRERTLNHCSNCGKTGHDRDAEYCKFCGAELPDP